MNSTLRFWTLAGGVAAFAACAVVLLAPDPVVMAQDKPQAGGAPAQANAFQYLGIKKCRMCHVDQFSSYDQSPKTNAWEALKANVGTEVKKKAGLDPAADYTQDVRCLKCHSTGFGEPGGYTIPDPSNKVSVALAASREGIGCESCHGPGSGFFEHMRDIYDTSRTYRREELLAAGLRSSPADSCTKCHNADATCRTGRADLNVDPKDRRGYHAEFPLRRRETGDGATPPADGEP